MLNEYLHIMSDPAHMLVEATFVTVEGLIIYLASRGLKRHFHKDIKENNVDH